jgi:hypothetical protein
MIKFFRKIRQKLLSENKFSKYLLYAIGEIVLVVVGILIALQINNANDARNNEIKEVNYLKNLKVDIKSDSLYYVNSWLKNGPRKIAGLKKAKNYYLNKVIPNDTIQFLNDVSFGGIYGIGELTNNNSTYKELISTGSISLITNEELRNGISDYYLDQEFLRNYGAKLQSGYANYINSVKVFNPSFPDSINTSEIPIMLKLLRKDEFYILTNQELTYAYSFLSRLEQAKKKSHLLSMKIEKYLKNKD